MKTPKHKLPKARVMFTYKNLRGEKCVQSHKRDLDRNPWTVAVIPCATRKQAAALVKFANMTEEERVERVARALYKNILNPRDTEMHWCRDHARAILREIGWM